MKLFCLYVATLAALASAGAPTELIPAAEVPLVVHQRWLQDTEPLDPEDCATAISDWVTCQITNCATEQCSDPDSSGSGGSTDCNTLVREFCAAFETPCCAACADQRAKYRDCALSTSFSLICNGATCENGGSTEEGGLFDSILDGVTMPPTSAAASTPQPTTTPGSTADMEPAPVEEDPECADAAGLFATCHITQCSVTLCGVMPILSMEENCDSRLQMGCSVFAGCCDACEEERQKMVSCDVLPGLLPDCPAATSCDGVEIVVSDTTVGDFLPGTTGDSNFNFNDDTDDNPFCDEEIDTLEACANDKCQDCMEQLEEENSSMNMLDCDNFQSSMCESFMQGKQCCPDCKKELDAYMSCAIPAINSLGFCQISCEGISGSSSSSSNGVGGASGAVFVGSNIAMVGSALAIIGATL